MAASSLQSSSETRSARIQRLSMTVDGERRDVEPGPSDRCSACGVGFTATPFVYTMGRFFHRRCFACSICCLTLRRHFRARIKTTTDAVGIRHDRMLLLCAQCCAMSEEHIDVFEKSEREYVAETRLWHERNVRRLREQAVERARRRDRAWQQDAERRRALLAPLGLRRAQSMGSFVRQAERETSEGESRARASAVDAAALRELRLLRAARVLASESLSPSPSQADSLSPSPSQAAALSPLQAPSLSPSRSPSLSPSQTRLPARSASRVSFAVAST